MSPPTRIGPWRVERALGRGGEAEVWLGVDDAGGAAAVKWYLHGGGSRPEARMLRRLSAGAEGRIATFVAEGQHEGRSWLATRWIDGMDLNSWAERLQRRPPGERQIWARRLGRRLADSLAWLHQRGVVHRDLKPSNVRINTLGQPVLIDFGIAAEDDGAQVARAWTPAWAAPEQRRGGTVDPRSDQFGLGALVFLLLVGEAPSGVSPARRDPTVPDTLDRWVSRLLAPDPRQRFPDMGAARDALGGDPDAGESIAGREDASSAVAAAVERADAGDAVWLRITGAPGSGRGWVARLGLEAAGRRGLRARWDDDARQAPGPGELLIQVGGDERPGMLTLELKPLSLSDVRRTIRGLPGGPTLDPVEAWRWSGGVVGLLVAWSRAVRAGRAPSVPSRCLATLSEPARLAATALAAADEAVDEHHLLPLLTGQAVPASETIEELETGGHARRLGAGRWALAADALRAPLLQEVPAEVREHLRRSLLGDPLLAELRATPAPDQAKQRLETEIQGDAGTAARWSALGELRLLCGEVVEASAAFQTARSAPSGGPDDALRAELGLARVAWFTGDLDAAAASLARARAVPRGGAARDPWVGAMEAEVLGACDAPGALSLAAEAVQLGEAGSSLNAAYSTRMVYGMLLLDHGEVAAADTMFSDAGALARSAGQPNDRARAAGFRAFAVLCLRADRASAATVIDRLRRLSVEDPAVDAAWAWALAVWGDRAGSVRHAREALAGLGREPMVWRLRLGLALAAAAAARADRTAVPDVPPGWEPWVSRTRWGLARGGC